MKNLIDVKIGDRFGKLLVVDQIKSKVFECLCDCGNSIKLHKSILYFHRKSCGCLAKKGTMTHGWSRTKLYKIWKGINGRCYVTSNRAYVHYGAKGVTSSWKDSFESFRDDMYESYVSHVEKFGEKETSIDRLNNKLGYSKENCRWSTQKEQSRNRTVTKRLTINGITKTVFEWSQEKGVPYQTLRQRIRNNWDDNIIFTKPIMGRNNGFRNYDTKK